jgi:hypothetical protein
MSLPIELLRLIFQYFEQPSDYSVFSQVCQQWNYLATSMLYCNPALDSELQIKLYCQSSERSRSFVQRLDLGPVSSWVTDDVLAELIPPDQNSSTNKSIRSLGFANCNRLSCGSIYSFLSSCSLDESIEEIVLANCLLSDYLLYLLSQSRSINQLNICNTMIQPCSTMEVSHGLGPYHGAFENLKSLDMSFCAWVDDATIDTVCQFRNLRKLSMRWCQRVPLQSIFQIVQNLPMLSSLDVRHVHSINSPEVIKFVLYMQPSLIEVHFTRAQTIMACAKRMLGGEVEVIASS